MSHHRKCQVIVTTLVLMTTAVSVLTPHWSEIVVAVGTLTNFIWIWIE